MKRFSLNQRYTVLFLYTLSLVFGMAGVVVYLVEVSVGLVIASFLFVILLILAKILYRVPVEYE
jgi:uncharacterized membrane protein